MPCQQNFSCMKHALHAEDSRLNPYDLRGRERPLSETLGVCIVYAEPDEPRV